MQLQVVETSTAAYQFAGHVETLRRTFPDLYRRLDPERLEQWQAVLEGDTTDKDDFGPEEDGGRGQSYVRAQTANVLARSVGIGQLAGLLRQDPPAPRTVVDLLGGDGLVRRVCSLLGLTDLEIMTCDASPAMVQTAWNMGVPALQQRAEWQLFRTGSLDGVLLAYGTHHIPPSARGAAAREACRVLGKGGVFVLHDFLIGSPMDTWFSTVVEPYSQTGHRYAHFTIDEIRDHLQQAGFDRCEVREIEDPYVATGGTQQEAELNLGEYLVNMYGLCRAREKFGDEGAFRWAIDLGQEIFRYPGGLETTMEYLADQRLWRLTVPRMAVVGIGRRH